MTSRKTRPVTTGAPRQTGFFSVIRARRSIRKFSTRAVSKTILKTLADATRRAPSSMGGQSVRIIVLRDRITKQKVAAFKNAWCPPAKRKYPADFLQEAPVLLIVCVNDHESHGRWIENGTIASTYIMLAATALGLGTTFLTAYDPKRPQQVREFKKLLRIPRNITPVNILPIGYPAEKQPRKKPQALREILHHESL